MWTSTPRNSRAPGFAEVSIGTVTSIVTGNCWLPFAGTKIAVPALYIAGERDIVLDFPGVRQRIADMVKFVPQLRRTIILRACGHWTQQERPGEVSTAMIEFLRGLDHVPSSKPT